MTSTGNQEFIKAYQSAYGEGRPINAIGEAAYDAVWLYALAVEKAGSTEEDKVIAALCQVEFDAPLGGVERDFTLALVRYTALFDHTGNPVVSLPVTVLSPGIGTSVQIVGPHHRDADVVALAARLERMLDLSIDFSIRT